VAIKVHKNSAVDFGGPKFPNRYDDPKGGARSEPKEFQGGTSLTVQSFYDAPVKIEAPKPVAADKVDWLALLDAAGPAALRGADDPRGPLRKLLAK